MEPDETDPFELDWLLGAVRRLLAYLAWCSLIACALYALHVLGWGV